MDKKLHIIAKDIVTQKGDIIITKVQFLNLLADLGAYKTLPATKIILNALFKADFGLFLYELKQNTTDNSFFDKCYQHRKEFLSDGKYREDLTEYVYSSLLYAIGLIDDVDEPSVKNPFSANASQNQSKKSSVDPKKPALNLSAMLEELKKEYLLTLDEIVLPQGKIIKASGYFSAETLNKQYILENKIIILSKRLGKDVDWCKNEKNKVLSKHIQSKSSQRTKLGCLISIPIFLLALFTSWTYQYISSASERAEFEHNMSLAFEAKNKGEFIEALNLYNKAGIDYDASWRNGDYKSEALKEAQIVSSEIYKDYKHSIDSAYNAKDYITTLFLMKSIPAELKLAGDDWNHYSLITSKTENLLETTVNESLDAMLKTISQKGTITSEQKEIIKKLIIIEPDNYWIKFIKNKEGI